MIQKMVFLTILWVVFIGNFSFETLIIGACIGVFLIHSDLSDHFKFIPIKKSPEISKGNSNVN